MKVKYFPDTDTLFIKLNDHAIVETRELSDHVLLDMDREGKIVSLTVEHAKEQTGKLDFSYELVAA